MIGCYLLYSETVPAEPVGDFADSVLRRAEARRKLFGSQELVELRRLPILLLRYQLIERRYLSPIRRQQQNHVFHRKARIYRHCTYCVC